MLDTIRRGAYKGVSYNHLGPAHLSAGQESAAVGQALALSVEDQIFGSHRTTVRSSPRASAIVQLSDDG